MKKLSQFLKVHISEMPGKIYLKFGMWGTDGGGHFHSKNHLVSYKQHKVTYTQKLRYCSSCQYTHECGVPASWAACVCLDVPLIYTGLFCAFFSMHITCIPDITKHHKAECGQCILSCKQNPHGIQNIFIMYKVSITTCATQARGIKITF